MKNNKYLILCAVFSFLSTQSNAANLSAEFICLSRLEADNKLEKLNLYSVPGLSTYVMPVIESNGENSVQQGFFQFETNRVLFCPLNWYTDPSSNQVNIVSEGLVTKKVLLTSAPPKVRVLSGLQQVVPFNAKSPECKTLSNEDATAKTQNLLISYFKDELKNSPSPQDYIPTTSCLAVPTLLAEITNLKKSYENTSQQPADAPAQ